MAFANEFTNNLSAIVGNPTRAIEYNQLARNSDANKERFIQGHHFNNIGIVNEDGYHFGDYSNPLWMYSKSTGNSTAKYSALWVNTEDANPHLRVKIQSTTAAISAIDAGSIFGIDVQPEGTTGRLIVSNNTQLLAEDNLLYESSNMSGALVFYDLNASNATGSIVGQIAFTDTSDHVENNVVIGSIGFQKSKDNNVGSEIFFINGVKGTSGGSPIVVNIENIRMSTFGTSIKTLLVGNTSEISTSAPSNILEVSSSSAANVMALRTTSTDGAYMQIYESATKLGEIGAVKGILTSSSSSTDIGIKAVGGIHLATNGDNTQILIDTTGAIGIGKTPDTWHSNNISRLQLNANGNIFTRSEGLYSTSNFYYDASDAGRFQENGYAISQSHNTSTGQILFSFSTSSNSSGAGALASIATTMAVESSAVGINTTTPTAPVDINTSGNTHLIFKYQNSSTQRSFIATNAGISTAYNGLVIGSNATQQGTQANTGLSSWYQRLGPTDATGDAWSVAYQAAGGSVVERARITSTGVMQVGGQTGTLKLGNDGTYYGTIEWEYANNELAHNIANVGTHTFNTNSKEVARFTQSNGSGALTLKTNTNQNLVHMGPEGSGGNEENGFLTIYGNGTQKISFISTTGPSYINTGQNFGIGTSSPQVDFHVDNASTNGVARISTSHTTSYAQLQLVNQSGNYWYQTIVSDNSYRLFNGSDRLTLLSDGKLGLGCSDPNYLFSIQTASNHRFFIRDSSTSAGSEIQLQAGNDADNALTNLKFAADNYFFEQGNVGISTDSPAVALEVNAGSDGAAAFRGRSDGGNGNNARFNLLAYSDGGGAGYGGGIKIQTRDTVNVFHDALTVDSSQRVGIGTVSPTQKLTVVGSINNGIHVTADTDTDFDPDSGYANDALILKNSTAGNNNPVSMYFATGSNGEVRFSAIDDATSGDANLNLSLRQSGGSRANVQFWEAETGFVGINTTSPDALIHVSQGGSYPTMTANTHAIVGNTSSGSAISRVAIMAGATTGYSVLDFGDTDASNAGGVTYSHQYDRLNLCAGAGATRASIDSDGLKFGTDTAADNALNDYEEGTWTPTINGSTTNPTVTYNTATGIYTKIGDIVYMSGYVYVTAGNLSGGAGNIQIGNIPYSVKSGTLGAYQSLQLGYSRVNGVYIDDSNGQARLQANSTTHLWVYGTNNSNWGSGVYELSFFGTMKIA